MVSRIYFETIKKHWKKLLSGGIGVPLIVFLFAFLQASGGITIHSHSGDSACMGAQEDPCYAVINFTAHRDIFLYKTDYDPWGRNVSVANFNKPLRDWKLQRSWGDYWVDIPLDTGCTGSWCGCYWCRENKTSEFAYAFRKGRNYSIRIVAYKEDPMDRIKWGFGLKGTEGYVDPWWNSAYDYRRNITDRTSSDIGMGINGTNGFGPNIIWYNPSQVGGTPAVYYNSTSVYAVANDTDEQYYETEGGGLNNSISSVWNFNAAGIWHLGESSGNVTYDSTSNNNDGTIYGQGANGNFTTGVFGNALSFDGSDDYVEIPDSSSLNENIVGELTFCTWTYWDGGNTGDNSGLVMIDNKGNNGVGLIKDQYVDSDNSMIFTITVGGTGYDLDSPNAITENEWIFWCGRYNGSEISIWRNGTKVNSVSDSGDITTTTDPLVIGSRQLPPAETWAGTIDEIRIYNRSLSATEISELYSNSQNLNNLLGAEESAVADTPPNISYTDPTTSEGTLWNQDWIQANVTASDESSVQNLTIRLYNGTSLFNESVDTTDPTQHYVNFSGLTYDTYYLNATAYDDSGQKASTSTRTITLDSCAGYPVGDSCYSHKRNVTNETTSDIGMAINDTSGFCDNILWSNPYQGNLSIYYNNCTDYAIANETSEVPFETEGGGLNNLIGDIWSSNAQAVYHLNGTSDSSVNNYDGTNMGATQIGNCLYGSCYDFNETDKINTTYEIIEGATEFTLMTFVKSTQTGEDTCYYSKGESELRLGIQSAGTYLQSVMNGTPWGIEEPISEDSNVHNGEWYLATLTFDSNDVASLYINDTLVGTNNTIWSGMAVPTGRDILLGARYDDYGAFDGKLEEMRVYNKALTQTEISEVYNNSQNLNNLLGAEGTQGPIDIAITRTSPTNTTYTTQTVWINGTTNENGNITYSIDAGANQTACLNCSSFSNSTTLAEGDHNVTIYAVEWQNTSDTDQDSVVFSIDTTPPSSVSNLDSPSQSGNWIYWNWTNPPESDFNHTNVYLNGSFETNTSNNYYNATGLEMTTDYEIQTRTIDDFGNINTTWINDTASTSNLPFIIDTQEEWKEGTTNNTHIRTGNLELSYYDNFVDINTSIWTLNGACQLDLGYEAWSPRVRLTNSTNQINDISYDSGMQNKDWVLEVDVDKTGTDNGILRVWFSSNHDQPQSNPSSTEGWTVEWNFINNTIYIKNVTGGSWNEVDSLSPPQDLDASSYGLKLDYSSSGHMEVWTGGNLTLDADINPSYTNNSFYIEGESGSTATNLTIDNVDISVLEENTYQRTINFTGPQDLDKLNLGAIIWEDWEKPTSGEEVIPGGGQHDPVVFSNGSQYHHLFVRNATESVMDIYNSTDMENWQPQSNNEFQDLAGTGRIRPDGKYVLYDQYGDYVYTSLNLTDWTQYNWDISFGATTPDPGAYYDNANSQWHILYEAENGEWDIEHTWTNDTDGIANWTKDPDNPVMTGPGKKGDVDIIKLNGIYHVFSDDITSEIDSYRIDHYTVENWTDFKLQDIAVTPGPGGHDQFSTGDAVVRYAEGYFYLFHEIWNYSGSTVDTTYARGPGIWDGNVTVNIEIDTDNDLGNGFEESTGWQKVNANYSVDQNMDDINCTVDSINLSGLSSAYSVRVNIRLGYANSSDPEIDSLTVTGSSAPNKPTNPDPADGATGVSTNTNLSAYFEDSDGDTMNASFYWSNDTLIQEVTGISNGTRVNTSSLSLSRGTTYEWYVNVTDGGAMTQSDTWNFTTGEPDINVTIWNGNNWLPYNDTNEIEYRARPSTSQIEPENQDVSINQSIYQIVNNGTADASNIIMKMNRTFTDINQSCDDDYNYTGAVQLTTSYQQIHGSLAQGSSIYVSCWADYGLNPEPGLFTNLFEVN